MKLHLTACSLCNRMKIRIDGSPEESRWFLTGDDLSLTHDILSQREELCPSCTTHLMSQTCQKEPGDSTDEAMCGIPPASGRIRPLFLVGAGVQGHCPAMVPDSS